MPILITTPGAVDANSYCSVAQANAHMSVARLYTDAWFQNPGSDAEAYTVKTAALIGDQEIEIEGGTGAFEAGCLLTFDGSDTVYEAVNTVSGDDGILEINPPLTDDLDVGATIERLTPNTRERALAWATDILDSTFDWKGTYRFNDQARRWPRSGVYDHDGREYDYDTLPPLLIRGTAELGFSLVQKNRTLLPAILSRGIKRGKIDTLEFEVDKKTIEQVVDRYIVDLLSPLGSPFPGTGWGDKVVKLVRS